MSADAAKLVHQRKAAQNGVVTDRHVTGQAGAIGENRSIADLAVMRQMAIGHDEIVMTEPRHTPARHGGAIESAVLPDDVPIADLKPGGFAFVPQMLRRIAQGRELVNFIVPADTRRPVDDDVRTDPGIVTDLHARTDDAEGTNMDVFPDFRARVNDGLGMYHSDVLISEHQFRAATHRFTHIGLALEKPDPLHFALDRSLDGQLVAGFDRTLEAGFIDANEIVNRTLAGH